MEKIVGEKLAGEEIAGEEIVGRASPDNNTVWLELLSRQRDVVARHRFTGRVLHVGRGYDNDLILDDPYVAVRHLRIFRDDAGGWIAEDLGSTNGLFADKRRQPRVALDNDRIISIGQTYLRLRQPSHMVPPERVSQPTGRTLLMAFVVCGLTLAMMALTLWLSETAEPKLGRYLVPLLALPLIVLAWTGTWAILTRIFSGQARFERHLLIAATTVLLSSLIETGGKVLAFAGSWPDILTYQYVVVWILSGTAIYCHLWVIGPSHQRLKGGLVAALVVVGLAIQSASLFDSQDRSTPREVHLMPPSLRLAPLQTTAMFFANIDGVKAQLERDRRRAAGAGSDMSDDDEDDED